RIDRENREQNHGGQREQKAPQLLPPPVCPPPGAQAAFGWCRMFRCRAQALHLVHDSRDCATCPADTGPADVPACRPDSITAYWTIRSISSLTASSVA